MAFARMPTSTLPRAFAGIGLSATLSVMAGFVRLGCCLLGVLGQLINGARLLLRTLSTKPWNGKSVIPTRPKCPFSPSSRRRSQVDEGSWNSTPRRQTARSTPVQEVHIAVPRSSSFTSCVTPPRMGRGRSSQKLNSVINTGLSRLRSLARLAYPSSACQGVHVEAQSHRNTGRRTRTGFRGADGKTAAETNN